MRRRREATRHYYNPVRQCHNRFPALEIRVRSGFMGMKWGTFIQN
jgi:hypothetical protein